VIAVTALAALMLLPALLSAGPGPVAEAVRMAVETRLREDRAAGRGAIADSVAVESFRIPRLAGEAGEFRVVALPPGALCGPVTVMVAPASGAAFPVSCTVRTFGTVLVAVRRFDRHAAMEASGIVARTVETTRLPADRLADPAMLRGLRAKRILNPGSVLSASMCEPLPAVLQGDEVNLLARGKGVRLTVRAVARQDGLPGRTILVQPDGSHERVRSRVIDRCTVEAVSDGEEDNDPGLSPMKGPGR
jgi:flagella basal body P-ring formation protein FlgA